MVIRRGGYMSIWWQLLCYILMAQLHINRNQIFQVGISTSMLQQRTYYNKFILILILGNISNIVKTIIYRASFIQTHPICNKTRLESNRKTSVLGSLPSATLKVSHMEFKHVRLRSSNVLLNGSGSQINKVRNGCFKTKV